MPRLLSPIALQAIYAPQTDQIFLALLTLAHPLLTPSLYFANNTTDIVRLGNTYKGWPFQLSLPGEYEDQIPTVQLQIDNVDRKIMEGVRALPTPPTITLEIVLAASPDTLEAGPFPFTLRQVQYTAFIVTGTLQFEDLWNEPYPRFVFDPSRFPGLFP